MPSAVNITLDSGLAAAISDRVARRAPYVEPRWAEDGMRVIIPFPTEEKPRQGLWCKVAVAAGNHARVVNAERGIDRWFPLYDLRVPADDPHA
jgi:hypothetical protein